MLSIFFYHSKIYLRLFSAYLKYTLEALFLETMVSHWALPTLIKKDYFSRQ